MASQYYRLLINRNKQLCRHFLNRAVFSYPDTPLSQDKLRAYRLLVHAEIEYYLETIVNNKVQESLSEWEEKSKINIVLLSLLAYNKREFPAVPSVIQGVTTKNDLNFRVHGIISDFFDLITTNHGIKEKNISNLLIRIGVDAAKIDQTLISNMNSYGGVRGDLAHTTYKIQKLINPYDEKNAAERIINDLQTLDEIVMNLK
jgi:hypothetical protein